jgi:3-oxoacyl-[acyl-carrier-protein] synthase-3
MAPTQGSRIIGMGSYLPEKVLTNGDLEKMVDTNDEWIVSRTGMKERRIAGEGEYTSTMGAAAARKALEQANLKADSIDLIIVATATPDYPFPSTASLIQHEIGAKNAGAFDISAACTGFLYALSTGKAFVDAGMKKNVLVIASEKLSSIVNYEDRATCILFGDGAAAAVVSGEGAGLLIQNVRLGSDGECADLIQQPAGGCRHPATAETVAAKKHCMHMNGSETYKHAVRRMESISRECMEEVGLTEEEIQWVVPHQANIRIIDAIGKRLNVPAERVYTTVHKYGNTSASAVAIALDELLREDKVAVGDNVLLMAFGAGLTFAASVLKKVVS